MENYGCLCPEGTHVEKASIIKFSPYFDPAVVSLNKGNASYKEYISEILHNISLSFWKKYGKMKKFTWI